MNELSVNTVICGDALEVLKTLPSNSVDSIITDPPYGLGEVKDIAKLLQAWINDEDGKEYANKKGFMSADWDIVPSPRYWREAYRVMKPGAYLLAFAGTRTWDLMSMSIRLAGFEDRDTIASQFGVSAIQWCYGAGFPKSTAIDKQIDRMAGSEREVIGTKRSGLNMNAQMNDDGWHKIGTGEDGKSIPITAPSTDAARQWAGWGTNLKPAWEPILMFRKPISENNIAANVLKWGTGAINIDACRIGSRGESTQRPTGNHALGVMNDDKWKPENFIGGNAQGKRWPANFLLSHTLYCRQTGVKRVRSQSGGPLPKAGTPQAHTNSSWKMPVHVEKTRYDEDGMETIDAWECDPSCPVRILGEQSGVNIARTGRRSGKDGQGLFGLGGADFEQAQYRDTGTASRYFAQFSPSPDELEVPFYYCSKASKSERNKGCEDLKAQPSQPLFKLRSDLTPEQVAYVEQELAKIGGTI